jgi:hypothetical protein
LSLQRQRTVAENREFPSLRVEPELREAAEQCLQEGETTPILSGNPSATISSAGGINENSSHAVCWRQSAKRFDH